MSIRATQPVSPDSPVQLRKVLAHFQLYAANRCGPCTAENRKCRYGVLFSFRLNPAVVRQPTLHPPKKRCVPSLWLPLEGKLAPQATDEVSVARNPPPNQLRIASKSVPSPGFPLRGSWRPQATDEVSVARNPPPNQLRIASKSVPSPGFPLRGSWRRRRLMRCPPPAKLPHSSKKEMRFPKTASLFTYLPLYFASASRSAALTSLGSALPRSSFMHWPVRKP